MVKEAKIHNDASVDIAEVNIILICISLIINEHYRMEAC